ncbi:MULTISPECIES: class II D-tagatose-bisphosphate aldolase, non-catalytic subunit [unclassified Mesorhizobium]|uniref:class II D-tagatose-bisphosphate aldolase, non-catalytic subunit n=1 Tax=unclassified Mesorhizobium TaxID=325217 RepID=UPI001CCBF727|nr:MULTISPECIES: class II D-tagatose-bisphosphate aldolase, non-catalytic subunit [unclassified Mesorhizobium]MBZ9811296.1 class II D-tagatose-bisphosphate aldolase, non-catalytic subunit [Mesorhizobium sp. ESP-6-2]
MMKIEALSLLIGDRPVDMPLAVVSICTAHPQAIEAALRRSLSDGSVALIEATCNQVNQDGGYTGMTPADFRRFVEDIADRVGFDRRRLILGCDHLGPHPWRKLPARQAMEKARFMMHAYVDAGFEKIHLDTSMGCAGEPVALDDSTTAARAADLAVVAEAAVGNRKPIVYVVGTEVPPPGGATGKVHDLSVTTDEAARQTLAVHHEAFRTVGIDSAVERIIGLVVQPGVEFGNDSVAIYDRLKARRLSEARNSLGGVVFEAHSTDYQPAAALQALAEDGFAILKVGPALTFSIREALYGLDHIAQMLGRPRGASLREVMEREMLAAPDHWRPYYPGSEAEQHLLRHFSYSDRIRYYWADKTPSMAVKSLLAFFGERPIPETLISQHLGRLHGAVIEGLVEPRAEALLLAAVDLVVKPYADACRPGVLIGRR